MANQTTTMTDAEKKVADAEKKVAEAQKELADAEKPELTPSEKKIADAQKKLADAEKELADAKKKDISPAEKTQIVREAVSYYLRSGAAYTKEIQEVCEEYIAGVDKEARTTAESGTAAPAATAHHTPPTPTAQQTKKS